MLKEVKNLLGRKIRVAMYLNHSEEMKNACTVYRNISPFKYLKDDVEVKYVHRVETQIDFSPITKKIENIKIDAEPIEWADIVVFSRHYYNVALMGCLSEVAEKMNKVIVYETDDLLHKLVQNVGKHNVKDIQSKMGNDLRFVDYALENADLITVSTENLRKFYSEKTKRSGVQVLPNCFDPSKWRFLYEYKKVRDFIRKKILKKKKIRIGWQGGNNHFLNNFNYIVDPLNELHKKYGTEFEFVIMSGMHPGLDAYGGDKDKRKFLDFDYIHINSVSIDKFPRKLAEMDLDIGLIFVEDNEFSRAKSNIKWMEYSLLGIPSISSRCEPYLETNAILVNNTKEEWMEAIERLMQNPELCDIIGKRAREMAQSFNIKNRAKEWLDAYLRVLVSKLENKKVADLDSNKSN